MRKSIWAFERCRAIAVALGLLAPSVWADSEFQTGCARAATEVLCVGHADCVISSLAEKSSSGNESEKGGFAECSKVAKAAKARGLSVEAKRAVGRLQAGLNALNKDLSKEFPFIKVTADFKRLELEDVVRAARAMASGKDRGAPRSVAVMLSGSDSSKSFEMNYLNPIKTALFNAGKDDLGVGFLKERLKEVRFAFHTHGWTSFSQNIKVVDRVLLVPGIQPEDNTSYCGGVQQFIEKHL